ncbi:MAG: hypothetical protein AAGA16_11755, partial [Cyanobacteria bacterium P01_E01_bin.35]
MTQDNINITELKDQFETLQDRFNNQANKPWYKTPSTIISLLALLFSFGTTGVSYYESTQAEIREKRIELRGLLQRIANLPKENVELTDKYKNSPELLSIRSLINQEYNLLTTQSAEITNDITSYLSANEFYSVASALMQSASLSEVDKFLQLGIKKANNNPAELAPLLRTHGTFLIGTGEISEGRKSFEKALQVWNGYNEQNPYFKTSEDIYTHLSWASIERHINNVEESKVHIRKAYDLSKRLTPGPNTDSIIEQIKIYET